MKPDHPDMVSLRSQIDELQKQITQRRRRQAPGRSTICSPNIGARFPPSGHFRPASAQFKGDVLNLRGRSIQYKILQREVDTNRASMTRCSSAISRSASPAGSALPRFRSSIAPTFRAAPFKPNLMLNLLVGLGLGLLAGIAAAVGLEFLNDTIKSRDDVRKKLVLPCLGMFPKTAVEGLVRRRSQEPDFGRLGGLFGNRRGAPVQHGGWYAEGACSLPARDPARASLRRRLLWPRTSPGEGNRAADRQRLAQACLQDVKRASGPQQAADHRRQRGRSCGRDAASQFWLLPSGPIPPSPADLLSTGRIRKIIAEASEGFELVVIDGPPTLGLADAPLLAAAAGSVVFVVESAKTRTRAAIEALNRLEATGTHILGRRAHEGGRGGGGYGYGRMVRLRLWLRSRDRAA